MFVASHLVLSYPPMRAPVVARLGEQGFRALYSVLAVALIVWVVKAYNDAPMQVVWTPPIGLRHLSLLIMPFACILLVAGVTTANPAAIGTGRPEIAARPPAGILKVTRHPVMWGIALWGVAHLLANGDVASILLFGGMTVLALAGSYAQDIKKRLQLGAAWAAFAAQTSFLPFAAVAQWRARLTVSDIGWWRIGLGLALYALLLVAHNWLFGVSPLPLAM